MHFTALLYLNSYNVDFTGGLLVVGDVVVMPRRGQLVIFTSGEENEHQVMMQYLSMGSHFFLRKTDFLSHFNLTSG